MTAGEWQTGVRGQDRCSKQGGVVLDQHAGLRQSWQCACHKQQAGGLLQQGDGLYKDQHAHRQFACPYGLVHEGSFGD